MSGCIANFMARRSKARLVLLVIVSGLWAEGPTLAAERGRTPIDSVWTFQRADAAGAGSSDYDDPSWSRVTLPNSFNGGDGDDGGDYYRGPAWYRTHVTMPAKTPDRRYFLEFDGAALATDLWVNGRRIGRHEGGYARFRFDVTNALQVGRNSIAVRVDNSHLSHIAPLGGDFTIFGGLYRRVWLVTADALHFDMMDDGGPGIYVSTPKVTADAALIRARLRLSNDTKADARVRYQISLHDAEGRAVARSSDRARLLPGHTSEVTAKLALANPHLWNSIADPYLYKVVVTLSDAKARLRDRVELPLGIRSIDVTADKGLLLNGKPYRLRGVNYFHAQRPGRGTAVTDEEISEDMRIIADMGTTAVRFVHYQHPQRAYEEADRMGLLVWTEIPLNGVIDKGEAFEQNIAQQMRELIAQNAHHPSVAVWGLGNEVYEVSDDVLRVLRRAEETVRAADSTRPTSYAHCCQNDDNPKALVADISAFNRYFGWYPDQKGSLGEWARKFHERFPERAFAVGEYGAGGGIRAQESDPAPPVTTSAWHPEQYQTLYHEQNWREIRDLPFLWGSFIWVAFDLASDGRREGDRDGINDKGLVTYDRSVRKDAYYWYQANWSKRPMLHLTERRHDYRTQARVTIRAYSNQPAVRLTVNGRALPEMPVIDHVAAWTDVTLAPGSNRIELSSGDLRDESVWTYDPNAPLLSLPPGTVSPPAE
ncbi:beta-galactosidase [Sphingobium sp. OAS761]|uniref:glycoside hydrolase family 2 protein n=1 Tax=Sphingobium sp. OAS761 TaxID=2817901 RepID=UPI00209E4623|nr:glycoside hydrolase family 2 TIM barrel-domain containing protein [Sphingobium sp. OAS761]MCP1469259.1 beta-galactosidase [Sphingobium sp. OAS761]